jgi:phosphate transport system substrate-binding protein
VVIVHRRAGIDRRRRIDVKDNLLFSALNAKGDKAYPITYQSWVIVYAEQADQTEGAALEAYVKYLVSDGQEFWKELEFAPLPGRCRIAR